MAPVIAMVTVIAAIAMEAGPARPRMIAMGAELGVVGVLAIGRMDIEKIAIGNPLMITIIGEEPMVIITRNHHAAYDAALKALLSNFKLSG